jgi:hypothetical protein
MAFIGSEVLSEAWPRGILNTIKAERPGWNCEDTPCNMLIIIKLFL